MAWIRKSFLRPKSMSFEWKIERFFADSQNTGDCYASPAFPVTYASNIIEWELHVYPEGEREDYKDFMALFLHFSSDNDIEVKVNYQLSIVSEQNVIDITLKGKDTFKSPVKAWGWDNFIEHSVIKDPKNGVLVNDTLTILCEITFESISPEITDIFHGYAEVLDEVDDAVTNYEELLESGRFADITFNVKGKQINSHKNILSCRNPVFKAMFEHDMKEKNQNIVDITDIDYDIIKELFRFIYSGRVRNINKIARKLIIAADKYQVIELKVLCEKTLYNKLTVDNAIKNLKLTEMCDTIHLRRLVIEFIAANYLTVIKKSGFEDLNNKVMYQIMLAIANCTK